MTTDSSTNIKHPDCTYGSGIGQLKCSSYVYKVYKAFFAGFPTPSAANQFVCLEQSSDWLTAYSGNPETRIEGWEFKPGDLIFWSNNDCDCDGHCQRTYRIHHVAIYFGNGKIIDMGSKNNISIRSISSLYGRWVLTAVARYNGI